MMEKTDRHYRFFIRQITRSTLLYTEMITASAIIYGDRDYLLGFEPIEHPIALQLGGDDPKELEQAIRIAEAYGYDEYNLNVGCPSNRVQNANFGACLMADPRRVGELIEVMREATAQPVTVKHRIGIDGRESYEELCEFVRTVDESRPARFTVHARIAILSGLSPKENRMVPPLRYEDVHRLKQEFPELQIEINGHIKSIADIRSQLAHVDAVMVGRAAYDDPWLFHSVDQEFFGAPAPVRTRGEVIDAVIPYMERWAAAGWSERSILRHMLGLFPGIPGARKYRQILSGPLVPGAGTVALREAAARPDHRATAAPRGPHGAGCPAR